MLTIEALSYEYPQKDLFHKISFTANPGEHCALIGSSGTGKSTLLQMILYPEEFLFDGKILRESLTRPGYVSQFSDRNSEYDTSVFEFIAEYFLEIQLKIDGVCESMQADENTKDDKIIETLLEEYQNLFDQFQAVDGDNYESNIRIKLNSAGLGQIAHQKMSTLSGGEYKLVQIIREMLTGPDLMLMDEPDVFLDFENLNSLKTLINGYQGTMLVITHNQFLLHHCFQKILHIENKILHEFEGTLQEYQLALLQYKLERQETAAADLAEAERNAAIIERLRISATNLADPAKGKALKTRVKLQERLLARMSEMPFIDIEQPNICFPDSKVSAEQVLLTIDDHKIAFDKILFQNASLTLHAGEKVALIGENGTGKTTLLREIYANASEDIQIDPDTKMAFLSQFQSDMLHESNTVLEEFLLHGFERVNDVTDKLVDYHLNPECLNQKITELSGGEKNLLQLALISVSPTNLLLLDEPTSHLDIYAQSALERAVRNYRGAILMVSHDFYTIASCADTVYIIENGAMRSMSMRAFRKMIYSKYFDKDYLLTEQKRSELTKQAEEALSSSQLADAKLYVELLEDLL